MIKGIKKVINNQILTEEILLTNRELLWANNFHDSIRGKKCLQELNLNIGRWAGNYSFFYILNRVLMDYKPIGILDLGLGESSKFISTYLDNFLPNSFHTIIEQSEDWIKAFNERFKLSIRSEIINLSLDEKYIKNHKTFIYKDFENKVIKKYELYIIDGPYGSDRYSRYDIVSLVEKFTVDDEFLLLIDDSHRIGELDTIKDIQILLNNKNIIHYIGHYHGLKKQTIIGSKKYKYATSL